MSAGRHRAPAEPRRRFRPGVAPVLGVLLLGSSLAVAAGVASAGGRPGGSPAEAPLQLGRVPVTVPATPTSPGRSLPANGFETGSVAPAAPAVTTAPTWAEVLAGLDERRAAAFASGDAALLSSVYASGSPAAARDADALAGLVAAHATAHGLRPQTVRVQVSHPAGASPDGSADRVTLLVVDRLAPYLVVDAGGVATRRPGRPDRRWEIDLVRVAGEWRVADIQAA